MRDRNISRWFFVLPALIVVAALILYPLASSVFFSFTNKNLLRPNYHGVGFGNYLDVLKDPTFWQSFWHSVVWTVCSLLGQIIIGFTAALALNKVVHFKGVYRTLLIIPWAFPTIVIAFAWKWLLNGVYGFIPHLLVQLGLAQSLPHFLTQRGLAFATLIFINIWFGAPMIMVNILAALQTVPRDQYEAARIDGAGGWQQFKAITLQHIKMVVGLLIVLRTVWIFNNFDIIYLITGGGPADSTSTVPIYAYNMGWVTKLLGTSSAVTVLLFAFLLIICGGYFLVLSRWEREEL